MVLLDMGAQPVLSLFRQWATREQWTRHDWMREEVLSRLCEVEELLLQHAVSGRVTGIVKTEAMQRNADGAMVQQADNYQDRKGLFHETPLVLVKEPFFCNFQVRVGAQGSGVELHSLPSSSAPVLSRITA